MQRPLNIPSFGKERPSFLALSLSEQGPAQWPTRMIVVLQILQRRRRIFLNVAAVFRLCMIRLSKPLPG
jgi:hypothetical protein